MAMSHRKPVLASDLDSMKELIRDDETGFLFKANDIGSLSHRLISILSDQNKLDMVADMGYTLVKEEYNWKRIGEKTRDCYLSLG